MSEVTKKRNERNEQRHVVIARVNKRGFTHL